MCDEPNPVYKKGKCLDSTIWSIIKKKIENKVLSYNDIKETPLVELLNTLSFEDNDFDIHHIMPLGSDPEYKTKK